MELESSEMEIERERVMGSERKLARFRSENEQRDCFGGDDENGKQEKEGI